MLDSVKRIDREAAKGLLDITAYTILGKIRASSYPDAVRTLLDTVRRVDEGAAEWLEKETS